MNRILAFLLSLLLFLAFGAGPLVAGEVRQIELNDGSVLTGEVLSFANGVYTIRTGSLGTVTIGDSKVRSIRTPDPAALSTAPDVDVSSLKQRMESDQEVMDLIRGLKDDPEFRDVLQDPEIMKAVQAGDLATLMSNEKFLKLLNNRKTLEIKKKVTN